MRYISEIIWFCGNSFPGTTGKFGQFLKSQESEVNDSVLPQVIRMFCLPNFEEVIFANAMSKTVLLRMKNH